MTELLSIKSELRVPRQKMRPPASMMTRSSAVPPEETALSSKSVENPRPWGSPGPTKGLKSAGFSALSVRSQVAVPTA